jgi:hypothetical protein
MGIRKRIFIGALVIVVTVNVAQFRAIDDRTNDRYSAINRYSTADIVEIGYRASPHFRQAYGLHLALAQIAPGANVTLPVSGVFSEEGFGTSLYGFGKIGSHIHVEYDDNIEKLLGDEKLTMILTDAFMDNDNQPYYIAANDEGGDRGEPWTIVSDRRQDSAEAASPESRKEFIVFRWYQPNIAQDYHVVLLETSLLPEDFQEGHRQ